MISIISMYYILIIFFALIGMLRGWAKEVVASAGLVLSLFTLKQFGAIFLSTAGIVPDLTGVGDFNAVYRRQFWILTIVHLLIAFFSYQGPSFATGIGQRLQRRESVQDKLLGGIFGTFNGYLIFGTLLSFLETRVVGGQFQPLPAGEPYPFEPTTIERLSNLDHWVFSNLPLTLFDANVYLLPLLMIALFLVVLIVII